MSRILTMADIDNVKSGSILASDGTSVMWGTPKYEESSQSWIDYKYGATTPMTTVEPKKYNTLYVYNLRVVDQRADSMNVGDARVPLTILEERIQVTSNQDLRAAIILKHAEEIKKVDPFNQMTIVIDYVKTFILNG